MSHLGTITKSRAVWRRWLGAMFIGLAGSKLLGEVWSEEKTQEWRVCWFFSPAARRRVWGSEERLLILRGWTGRCCEQHDDGQCEADHTDHSHLHVGWLWSYPLNTGLVTVQASDHKELSWCNNRTGCCHSFERTMSNVWILVTWVTP